MAHTTKLDVFTNSELDTIYENTVGYRPIEQDGITREECIELLLGHEKESGELLKLPQPGYIVSSEFVNTGGNIMNHIVTLKNGYIIRISDEGVGIYKNADADQYGEASASVEFSEQEYL